jgi:hypothetical protein
MKNQRFVRGLMLGVLLLTVSVLSLSTPSSAQIGIGISVRIGSPALPVYAQPICPGAGYLWTPGYWAWNDDGGYYWVPGTWVVAPVGLLWTPGYWGYEGGFYGWHGGYWGPHVGFYGGINYGFGYGGVGFFGGEWRGGAFFYNRAVMNVNVVNIHNVYNRTVIVNNVHTSFNGPGGIEARPTPQELSYAHEPHTAAIAAQREHEQAASHNRALFASENHGRPEIAATGRPGEFSGPHVERAKAAGGEYHEPKISPREARGPAPGNREMNNAARTAPRTNDRPVARTAPRETGNREQMSPRENARPSNSRPENSRPENTRPNNSQPHNTQPTREERPAPKQEKPPKAEPKHNEGEHHQERR